ncbi:kinase-like domain-containing protein [Mycena belliarum]|uniref:non-specific serine/threonine protein kinase n=1 Tax=Mycena belliarum TaxID=1033014 RepID=A0AAD6U6U9_9AGAR|nr:kinase-like domain-containing protein [Mycena belliae]
MTAAKYPKVVGYELVERIGGGGFSQVFRAVNLSDHRVAACKVLLLTRIRPTKSARQSRKRCVSYDAALKHRNILEVVDAVIVELKHPHHYVPGLYMLLELAAGGGLFDKIAPDVGVGDEVAHFYLLQPTARWNGIPPSFPHCHNLTTGQEYIYKEGVCHRDLKPENILLDIAGTLKISDFGLSSVFKLKETDRTRALTERCGSLPMWPRSSQSAQLNSDQPYEAEPIDLWGIGVILYTLLAGNTPWDEPTQNSPESARYLSGAIFHERPWGLEPLQRGGSLAALLQGLLTVEPRERCTLDDAFQHPWCSRQLAKQGAAALAQALTQSLRTAGDMDLAAPDLSARAADPTRHALHPAPHALLRRAPPRRAPPRVATALAALGATARAAPPERAGTGAVLRLRVGGHDARREAFRGWVLLEAFDHRGAPGCFCVMQKDSSPGVEPHVLRKRAGA